MSVLESHPPPPKQDPLTHPLHIRPEIPRSQSSGRTQAHWVLCLLRTESKGSPLGAQGRYSLQVAAELLLAAAGPVKSMEGSLYQGCHDAAQPHLITTAVALPIMLHAQPV